MRKPVHFIPLLLAGILVTLSLAGRGQTTSAESVTCSSTSRTSGATDLSGSWTDTSGQRYTLFQRGSCLWWSGAQGSNVFFGTVFGSTVTGAWANVSNRTSGAITFVFLAPRTLLQRGSAGAFRPGRLTKR